MVHNSDFTTGTVVVVVSVSFVNLAAGAWTHWTAPPLNITCPVLPLIAAQLRNLAAASTYAANIHIVRQLLTM